MSHPSLHETNVESVGEVGTDEHADEPATTILSTSDPDNEPENLSTKNSPQSGEVDEPPQSGEVGEPPQSGEVGELDAEDRDLYSRLCERLPYRTPTNNNNISHFPPREILAAARNTRPILHERTAELVRSFLEHKRTFGSNVEQSVYADMTPQGLVDRLLGCRPLMFMNAGDSYLLRTGERGYDGFEEIGTEQERAPLVLDALQSYDEMCISALLGVSVDAHFINDGNRYNMARKQEPSRFEPRGVYVGLVGARFERSERMEWQHLLVTSSQNTVENGYGCRHEENDDESPETKRRADLLSVWAKFYNVDYFPTFDEVDALMTINSSPSSDGPNADASVERSSSSSEDGNEVASVPHELDATTERPTARYVRVGHESFFDCALYQRRMRASLEPFLLDADERAAREQRLAYVQMVGLGLGVWRLCAEQSPLWVETVREILRETPLQNIGVIDFSYFRDAGVESHLFAEGVAAESPIDIRVSHRNPAAKLGPGDSGMLVVSMYAWDGNAYPGNEYWVGSLTASGDPAAACCSTIPWLQNPDVNPYVSGSHAIVFPRGSTLE